MDINFIYKKLFKIFLSEIQRSLYICYEFRININNKCFQRRVNMQ